MKKCTFSLFLFLMSLPAICQLKKENAGNMQGIINLQGQQLSKTPQHGLYIQNGKKICR